MSSKKVTQYKAPVEDTSIEKNLNNILEYKSREVATMSRIIRLVGLGEGAKARNLLRSFLVDVASSPELMRGLFEIKDFEKKLASTFHGNIKWDALEEKILSNMGIREYIYFVIKDQNFRDKINEK